MESPPRIRMVELMKLGDSELADLIVKSRKPGRGVHIAVDDWDQLPQEELGKLATRLQGAHNRVIEAQRSRPLDIAGLQSRLIQVLDEQGRRQHHDAGATTTTSEREAVSQWASDKQTALADTHSDIDSVTEVPEDFDTYRYTDEEEAHDILAHDGGRPLYPIHLLHDVLDNPDQHQAMLCPFLDLPSYDLSPLEDIFQKQLKRWKTFRRWQQDNRGLEAAGDNFQDHLVEVRKEFTKVGYREGLAKLDVDPAFVKGPGSRWWRLQTKRRWERAFQREQNCHHLSQYQTAVHARLGRHGYNDKNLFEPTLNENPGQQSALITWIEYLCFECWWLDHYAERARRLQPAYDAAWIKLQGLGVLMSNDTPESIHTRESAVNESDKIRQCRKAHLAATAAGTAQKAQVALDRAIARREALSAFVKETKTYEKLRQNMERQRLVVHWVAQQVALMREENDQDCLVTAPAAAAQAPAATTLAATLPTTSTRSISKATVEPSCSSLKKRKSSSHDDGDKDEDNDNASPPRSKRRKIASAVKNDTHSTMTATAAKPRQSQSQRRQETPGMSQNTTRAIETSSRKGITPAPELRRSARIRALKQNLEYKNRSG